MSQRGLFRLVHLPPDLARQLKDSVEEAFQGLGGATAELILHYARRRHHVDMNKLPDGIEELDNALSEKNGGQPLRRDSDSTTRQGNSAKIRQAFRCLSTGRENLPETSLDPGR